MRVSVVVCGYTLERTETLVDCIESVLAQTHEPIEVVVVVDGNPELGDVLAERFGEVGDLVLVENDQNRGISYSRTKGAEVATGEIVAFIDDDAIAEPDWIEELVAVYEETDAIAVGGYVRPDWVTEKPSFFPEEFYWLVGCTEPGFAEHLEEVRNTYGSNISYKRERFLEIGGYDANTGRKGDRHIQAHEAPAGIRLQETYGQGIVYTQNAVVDHQLFDYRGEFGWLVRRAFWQGFSKRVMEVLYPGAQGNEREYLRDLFLNRVPARIRAFTRGPSLAEVQQLVSIFVLTGAVVVGYVYGLTRRNRYLLRGSS